jgi:hypothetical protein
VYADSESALIAELQRIELEPLQGSVGTLFFDVQKQSARLDERLQRMLTDTDGQRLANVEGVRAFRIVRQETDSLIESMRLIQAGLLAERQKATGTLSTVDLNLRKSTLVEVQQQLQSSVQSIARLNEFLNEQLKQGDSISGVTLEAAIRSFQADIERKVEGAVVVKLQAAQSKDDEEIRKLDSIRQEKEAALREAESQLEKLQKESVSRLREIESSAETSARQRDLARTEARKAMEQALPGMRGLLSPVISKGYKQPDSSQSMCQ